MNTYNRIKQLLIEVSARNNPNILHRIATRKSIKFQKEDPANFKTSINYKKAKKYNSLATKAAGQQIPARGGRGYGTTRGYHGT